MVNFVPEVTIVSQPVSLTFENFDSATLECYTCYGLEKFREVLLFLFNLSVSDERQTAVRNKAPTAEQLCSYDSTQLTLT